MGWLQNDTMAFLGQHWLRKAMSIMSFWMVVTPQKVPMASGKIPRPLTPDVWPRAPTFRVKVGLGLWITISDSKEHRFQILECNGFSNTKIGQSIGIYSFGKWVLGISPTSTITNKHRETASFVVHNRDVWDGWDDLCGFRQGNEKTIPPVGLIEKRDPKRRDLMFLDPMIRWSPVSWWRPVGLWDFNEKNSCGDATVFFVQEHLFFGQEFLQRDGDSRVNYFYRSRLKT